MPKEKQVKGFGVEINQDSLLEALVKGLSVIQGDIDKGLDEFLDDTYDYAILNQTLKST